MNFISNLFSNVASLAQVGQKYSSSPNSEMVCQNGLDIQDKVSLCAECDENDNRQNPLQGLLSVLGSGKSDVDALCSQVREHTNQPPIVFRGTDRNDVIRISESEDGSLTVTLNGKDKVFSPQEANRLVIDCGRGDDFCAPEGYVSASLRIAGGAGNDKLYGGAGQDHIYGGDGRDYIFGGRGNDMINGGAGKDFIYGEKGNDVLSGGSHDDMIYDISGKNYIFGEQGTDRITVSSVGRDFIDNDGKDKVFYKN